MFTPNILDIEASGFGRGSYPIEIGFITSEQELGCCLVKPEESWTSWDEQAEKIHGIDRKIVIEKGKPILSVAHWLNDQFRGETVYSDAWGNDMCWLGRLFEEAEVVQGFKLESILSLLSEEEREIWAQVYADVLNETKLIRHRASNDARLIQASYLKLKQGAVQDNSKDLR